MTKPKVSTDPNVTAHNVLEEIMKRDDLRSQVMREMGRKGGLKGGKARASQMTKEELIERARKAGSAPKTRRKRTAE